MTYKSTIDIRFTVPHHLGHCVHVATSAEKNSRPITDVDIGLELSKAYNLVDS